MGFLNRLLLFIYTLGIMVALIVLGLAAAGWTTPVDMLQRSLLNNNERIVIGIVVAVFLILSIKFFLSSLSGEMVPDQAVVLESELGQVRVSAEAVANLVHRVASQVRGVREVKPRVVCTPEGLNVFIRVVMLPETHIPQTTDEIQNKVSNYMAEVAGVNVKSVRILVDSISSEAKPGTQRKLM